ncbi:MAG: ATP-dependent zinc protease [Sedimenticola sp.]
MKKKKQTLGWREWIVLGDLGLPPIKAKVDTGARTSALHAFKVRAFRRKGERWVRFSIHPRQGDLETVVECEAPVIDRRRVTDSGGHTQDRYVIRSRLTLGDESWPIELTLTNRDNMKFRALLGRTALKGRFLVDSGVSFRCGGDKQTPPPEDI